MNEVLTGLSDYKFVAVLVFLLGGGGLTTIVAAWFGWKHKKQDDREQVPTGFSAMFADRFVFERLIDRIDRLNSTLERALEKYEFHLMIESLKHPPKE